MTFLHAKNWLSEVVLKNMSFSEDDATLPKSFLLVPSERIPFSEGFDC